MGKLSRETPPPREGEPMGAMYLEMRFFFHLEQACQLLCWTKSNTTTFSNFDGMLISVQEAKTTLAAHVSE